MNRTLAALGLAALLSGSADTITRVPVGTLAYSSRPLSSKDFYRCTAVIVDYGDDAVMAHALPPLYRTLPEMDGTRTIAPPVSINNVVNDIEHASDNAFNEGVATIIGYKENADIVKQGLISRGIKEVRIITREELGSMDRIDIFYDPSTDELRIDSHLLGRIYHLSNIMSTSPLKASPQ